LPTIDAVPADFSASEVVMRTTLLHGFRRCALTAVALWSWPIPGLVGQAIHTVDAVAASSCVADAAGESGGGLATHCGPVPLGASTASGPLFTPQANFREAGLVLRGGRKLSEARKSIERAAEKGDVAAQVNLAVFYLNGWGTPQNYAAALYWLQSAAKSGSALAHTNLGILYLNGWGLTRDYAEAARNFRLAAERGESGAMVNLGYLSDSGLGTTQDQAAAAAWYRQAAERGDPLGENNLADLYLRGEGVPQSDALAFDWFQKAAMQHQTGAMIKLGFLYMTGRAAPKNPETAYAWMLAASLAGDNRGESYISALRPQLSAMQISRATQCARALLVRPIPDKTVALFR
jgi:TPR repeat protein